MLSVPVGSVHMFGGKPDLVQHHDVGIGNALSHLLGGGVVVQNQGVREVKRFQRGLGRQGTPVQKNNVQQCGHGGAGSVYGDLGAFDDPAPGVKFFFCVFAQLSRRHNFHRRSRVFGLLFHVWIRQNSGDFSIQLLHNIRRGTRRRVKRKPGIEGEPLQPRFRGRRQLRQCLQAVGTGHSKSFKLARFDVTHHRCGGREVQIHLPRKQILDCGSRTTIGNVCDEGTSQLLEQFSGNVLNRPVA